MIYSFKQFLNEEKKHVYKKGCVMAQISYPKWKDDILSLIDKDDVYNGEDGDDSMGLENEPHVTILFGIHADEVDSNKVKKFIEEYELNSFELELDKISIFEQDDYDVVKFDIKDKDKVLHDFNEKLRDKFPYTNEYDYHPHATIAYVKKGEGEKYSQTFDEPFVATVKKIKYSFPSDDGEKNDKFYIKLKEEK